MPNPLGAFPWIPITALLVCWGAWACQGGSTNQDAGGRFLVKPGCDILPAQCYQDNLCAERVCNGVGWTCARVFEGEFQWSRKGTCDDGDPCTQEDVCLDGVCKGVPKVCETSGDLCANRSVCRDGECHDEKITCDGKPNSTLGVCDRGVCKLTCEPGYGDCDGDSDNGCESALNSIEHCGQCHNECPGYDNADALCKWMASVSQWQCAMACRGHFQDCDKNWDNGCEIPVGVANTCNQYGVVQGDPGNTIPCGTAYCGQSPGWNKYFIQFDDYYCTICANCHYFDQYNMNSWCDWSTGEFPYPDQQGSCYSNEDTVCSP